MRARGRPMHRYLATVLAALALAAPLAAQAQRYPTHPVRIIVGYAAGSGPDVLARTVAADLTTQFGQQFFVENRPGANGTIGTQAVVAAEAHRHKPLFSTFAVPP